jgi:hypothetical protein
MIATRFIERMGGRVDRDAGIIRGAKLLGRRSRNGRTYTDQAMQEAAPRYNSKKVYVDHPQGGRISDDRPFRDWVGVIENAQFRGDGIYGDIRLRKQSEHFEQLMEAAESFDGFFGMSHVADGDSRMEGGEEIVESIVEIYSVDIVTEPATAAGLFESSGDADNVPDYIPRSEIEPVATCVRGLAYVERLRKLNDEYPAPKEWQPVIAACIDAGEAFRELLDQYGVAVVEPTLESHRVEIRRAFRGDSDNGRDPLAAEITQAFAKLSH